MNTITKSKILSTVVIILLIANMISMIIFWLNKQQPEQKNNVGNTAQFLIKELQLDSSQQKIFNQLKEEHHNTVEQLREDTRKAKDAFFDLLNKDSVNENELQITAANAANKQEQIDIITFRHFQKVKAICNDEQKKKFNEIIKEALRMQAPQGPPDKRPNPPDNIEHDGPPPPNDKNFDAPPPPHDGPPPRHP